MNLRRPRILLLCVDAVLMRAVTDALNRTCDLIWLRDSMALLRMAEMEQPAAAIVDIAMPNVNAVEALHSLKNVCSDVRRILLTDHCDLGLIVKGLHTGAVQNIVYKPIHPAELVAAIGAHVMVPPSVPMFQPTRVTI